MKKLNSAILVLLFYSLLVTNCSKADHPGHYKLPPEKGIPEAVSAAPESQQIFSWKEKGVVPPAKNQGKKCNSCWAFVSAEVFESKIAIHTKKKTGAARLYNLSEEQQISCNYSYFGCNGGQMEALTFWETKGPIKESCTGYPSMNGASATPPCYKLKCPELPYRLKNFIKINMKSQSDVKNSLTQYGPAYFQFNVFKDFITYWENGKPGEVYINHSDEVPKMFQKTQGHGVLIIGWDDKKQAWLCQNSWGEYEGPNGDGTFWMAYSGHKNNLKFSMANMKEIIEVQN